MERELIRLYLANLFYLSGRIALVAGGNSCIGRSVALGLAQAGAAIAALARNREKNQRVWGELKTVVVRPWRSGSMSPYGATAAGPGTINDAGVGAFGAVLEQLPEDWDRLIETHLNACFLLSKLAAGSMGQTTPRKNHQHR